MVLVDGLPPDGAFWGGFAAEQRRNHELEQQREATMSDLWSRLGLPPTKPLL